MTSYLAFRRRSWRLIEGNRAIRDVVAGVFVFACALSTLSLLAVRWPGWVMAITLCATFVIATPLVVWRVALWTGDVVARLVPVDVRVRLAARFDAME